VKKLKIINVNSSDVKEDVQLLLGLGERGGRRECKCGGKVLSHYSIP
jgi:hypothetical protein